MDKETKKETIEIPVELFTKFQEQQAEMERKLADMEIKNEGIAEMLAKGGEEDDGALKKKKNFEPKFRTVRIRKYPIAGDLENMGYVVGWTNRGAYQQVDRNGPVPVMLDFIDVIFYGQLKKDGKIQAEKIPLLSLLNAEQVHCKIIDVKKDVREVPTGEEINVTVWDPQHGLVETGDKVDGFVAYTDMTYTIQIPGIKNNVVVDGLFLN